MTNIEDRVSAALERRATSVEVRDDLDNVLADAHLIRFDHGHGDRRAGLVRPFLGAAATLAVVVAGMIWLTVSRGAPAATDQPGTATPSAVTSPQPVERLLYPAGNEDVDVTVGPDSLIGAAGLLQTPSGRYFQITVRNLGQWVLDPELEQRTIGTSTYAVEPTGRHYTTTNECALLGVTELSRPTDDSSSDTSALLGSLELTDQGATIDQPAGWTSLGVGSPSTLVQLSFQTTVDNTTISANLMQMLDAPIAALTFGETEFEPITFGSWSGLAAAEDNGDPFSTIIWNNNGNAAALRSTDATIDELATVAATLTTGHGADWNAQLDPAQLELSPAGTTPEPDIDLCPTPTLTITG